MAQDSLLGSPGVTSESPQRLADAWTPEAAMPPLRLADIMTPGSEAQEAGDYGTAMDSGHEASPPSTAIGAGFVSPLPDSTPTEDSQTTSRLEQGIRELSQENHLLRQKLTLLQRNSNLKQVALIGAVISWFGDKGTLGVDAACELTTKMMSARATDGQVHPASEDQSKAGADDAPLRLQTDIDVESDVKGHLTPGSNIGQHETKDTSEWPSISLGSSFKPPFSSSKKEKRRQVTLKSAHENCKFRSPGSRESESVDTYEWPSFDGSFNPPFSSSKKIKNPVSKQRDVTLLTEGPGWLRDDQETFANKPRADENTGSFDETTERLGNRIERMEKAVKVLSSQHADTQSLMKRTRQNATKRFRIWKAIAASRRLAAANLLPDEDGEVDEDLTMKMMSGQSVTPTPLTQRQCNSEDDEASMARVTGGWQSKEILGEIAFQVERRILAFVFQRGEILYGYNLGNLEVMVRTHPDHSAALQIRGRYELLTDVLRGYGWLRGRHSQFVADMIARHGIFQDVESAQAETMRRGWSSSSDLKRGVLCLCPIVEVLDLLVILDCLLHMARNDGLPVFLF